MLKNFTRRNKLDYEPCDLMYRYVPPAFRYDLMKLFFDTLRDGGGPVTREYALYRNLSVSIKKEHFQLFGEDEIHEFYSSDLLVELIRKAEWHEVLSIVEEVANNDFVGQRDLNGLFAYHNLGYELVRSNDGTLTVEIKYDAVIEDIDRTLEATGKYPAIAALVSNARKALADPKNIDVENSISNSIKALEGFLREWLAGKNVKAATLGDAVKEIKNRKLADVQITEALHQFYIYRNRTPNIGHGNANYADVSGNEALLMNEMAISFINYFHRLET